MKKTNLDEKIAKLNQFVRESANKTFTGAQLNEALMSLGFTKTIASAIAQRCFPYEKIGVSRLYGVPKTPIYIGILSGIFNQRKITNSKYNRRNKSSQQETTVPSRDMTAETAWEVLIKAGKVRQKFNIGKLKAEYPSIYLKCLEYEIIKEE